MRQQDKGIAASKLYKVGLTPIAKKHQIELKFTYA